MGGGHGSGAGHRATTEFPSDWSAEQIIAVLKDVANDPDGPRRQQYNGRWRCAGERYGVHVAVLVNGNGHVHTGYPLSGPGVLRNPDTARDPANPAVTDRSGNRISYFLGSLLQQLTDRLAKRDLAYYLELQWSGEWEELADTLAAHFTHTGFRLTADEFADFEKLLNSFDLPARDCVFLNDRTRILAELGPVQGP
ncbi:EndoU nuclease-like protein [Amycolatopsis sulphurea]|uniref:EndoU nuclease-like protein n=1 Tax=Amycolatopsis sulphurea TaxID=76022 RepID=A0A2A9FD49_9PSEU|nr:EndoU domain-containing protein [Amycolatopsis sulphurea]PFG48410.1 EndoU nuclease-like protein [Amycolatopsis sulphurea]